jgi:hypothetical protein
MKVGFFTVLRRDPQHYVLADLMIRSVRATMPDVEIVQLTDEASPKVDGADSVRRLPPGKMLERRIEHYGNCEGNWLLLDTDVIVRRDVREVFRDRFDVGLTTRDWPHIAQSPMLLAAMPFNTGVVFSRSPVFWRDVLAQWRAFPVETQQDWMSEQLAVALVANRRRSGEIRTQHEVMALNGMVYNCPPALPDMYHDAAILHFKGNRKAWMRAAGERLVATCA